VILFECLFGKAPFSGANVDELVSEIVGDKPIEIPVKPPISPCCQNLVACLLKRLNFVKFVVFIDVNVRIHIAITFLLILNHYITHETS